MASSSSEQQREDEEMERALAASLVEAQAAEAPSAMSAEQLSAMTAQEQDQLTINQMNSIVSAIAESEPMVGEKQGVGQQLAREYAENPMEGFRRGIEHLNGKYTALRRVRKDGNCFYRGFLYRYLETLVSMQQGLFKEKSAELVRIRQIVEASKAKLLSVGYEESAMDMFWEMLLELLDEVPGLDAAKLHAKLNDPQGVSNHVVWFCRALSAAQIKMNADRFAPFIMDENGIADVDAFCRTQVEPVNHECEQVQIIALTEMLQVPVAIEYLDASGSPSCIVFPDAATPSVKLLYRPGHYDILYD